MLLLFKISNPLVNEVQTSNPKVLFGTRNIFAWQIQKKGLQRNTNTNTITNTQEGAASYAMCIHWLDMPSPQVARPTIRIAVPGQFHPPN